MLEHWCDQYGLAGLVGWMSSRTTLDMSEKGTAKYLCPEHGRRHSVVPPEWQGLNKDQQLRVHFERNHRDLIEVKSSVVDAHTSILQYPEQRQAPYRYTSLCGVVQSDPIMLSSAYGVQ